MRFQSVMFTSLMLLGLVIATPAITLFETVSVSHNDEGPKVFSTLNRPVPTIGYKPVQTLSTVRVNNNDQQKKVFSTLQRPAPTVAYKVVSTLSTVTVPFSSVTAASNIEDAQVTTVKRLIESRVTYLPEVGSL